MKAGNQRHVKSKDDLRVSLPAGVKKLKKHGKAVTAVLTGDQLDRICDRGMKQLTRNASVLAEGLTSDMPDRKK